MAAPGVLLIDDSDKNCEKFVQHSGHAILFPRPWNSNHKYKDDPIGYLRQEYDILNNKDNLIIGEEDDMDDLILN